MMYIAIVLGTLLPLAAQVSTQRSLVGTVVAFRPEVAEIEIRPDMGDLVAVRLTADTIAQKIAPGERDLKKAESIKVADLSIGDRVLVTLEPDAPSIRRIVVMTATDIARRKDADRLDWQKRGVAGIVGSRNANHTTVKRYAPDSVKFSDAKASKPAEVSVGDQLRARGQKSDDGLHVAADEVVFGTFLVKAGSLSAINPEAKQLTVKELGTNRLLTVTLTDDSQLKEMPNFVGMMGGASRGGMPAGGPPPGAGLAGSSGPPAGGRGGMPGGGPLEPA